MVLPRGCASAFEQALDACPSRVRTRERLCPHRGPPSRRGHKGKRNRATQVGERLSAHKRVWITILSLGLVQHPPAQSEIDVEPVEALGKLGTDVRASCIVLIPKRQAQRVIGLYHQGPDYS